MASASAVRMLLVGTRFWLGDVIEKVEPAHLLHRSVGQSNSHLNQMIYHLQGGFEGIQLERAAKHSDFNRIRVRKVDRRVAPGTGILRVAHLLGRRKANPGNSASVRICFFMSGVSPGSITIYSWAEECDRARAMDERITERMVQMEQMLRRGITEEELNNWFAVSEKIRSNLEQYQGNLCREGQKKW